MFQTWVVQLAQIIHDLGVAIGAIVTGAAAFLALRTWRAELKGRKQFDLADKLYGLARQFATDLEIAQRAPLNDSELAGGPFANAVGGQPDPDNEHRALLQRAQLLGPRLNGLKNQFREAEIVLEFKEDALFLPFEKAWKLYYESIENWFYHQSTLPKSEPKILEASEFWEKYVDRTGPRTGNPNAPGRGDIREWLANIYGSQPNEVAEALEEALGQLRRHFKKFLH